MKTWDIPKRGENMQMENVVVVCLHYRQFVESVGNIIATMAIKV